MTTTALRIFGGAAATTIAGSVMWVKHQASTLPKDRQGPLADRCFEVVSSAAQSFATHGRPPSMEHLRLVASLSSRKYEERNTHQLQREQKKLATSYFAGYFEEVDTTHRNASNNTTGLAVFQHSSDLPVELPGGPFEGFSYAGRTDLLFKGTRGDFLAGNYVVCPQAVEAHFWTHEKPLSSISREKVYVTGTKDCNKCSEFRLHFLRDVVYAAATRGIDPLHPLSDTLVSEYSSDGSTKSAGDLTTLSDLAKKNIRLGNFTVTNFETMAKTRLSGLDYKRVGGIETGTTNQEASSRRRFAALFEMTRQR